MKRNYLLSFTLMVAFALALWTTMLSLQTPKASLNLDTNSLPDAFMEDVTALILNADGNPKLVIKTPKLIHYVNDDTTKLVTPEMTIFRNSPEPWQITSQFAKASHGIDLLDFSRDVTIHHPADANNPDTIIKTSALTVHTNTQQAETAESIILEQPNIVVKAIGMAADMKTGDIRLLSEARGEYVPNSP